ncbi:hypothetical protein [Rhodospirillum centenum]|uniref:Uncharacterized protein n=1 Tax=Rhodospirillum centenum (strain ATCC 51521 / SW) TaxID=414684 RepID=B6IX86_RHOCS|nr:hypothetical protein [Rhodospirillum centenum]ACJ00910.1 hypothetical protein RC1_3557 [Rhodospirillum centenum SW]
MSEATGKTGSEATGKTDSEATGHPASGKHKPGPPARDDGRRPADTSAGDGAIGDAALTEKSGQDPEVDRSKTPGRDYDV